MNKKEVLKKLIIGVTAFTVMISANTSRVKAADIYEDSYYVYYNSPVDYYLTDTCKINYSTATNTFTCSSISGNAEYIAISCTGANVTLNKSVVVTRTTSVTFKASMNASSADLVYSHYLITMDSTDNKTAYSTGSVSIAH